MMVHETYADMIAYQLEQFLWEEEMALILGVGVSDAKGIFGTTLRSRLSFPERILETPLSENALTGACVGLALEGHTPILVHARTDFLTLSAEHIVNSGAKWNQSHQSERMGRVIIRAIQGRGWGQGPQHSQNLSTMFLNVPGVNIWMPVTEDGYADALRDTSANIILIIEPRRLYDKTLLKADPILSGETIIFTYGDTILDALEAQRILKENSVNVDVLPIEQIRFDLILDKFPEFAIICESSPQENGLSCELALYLVQNDVGVSRVSPPFTPCPTSLPLEAEWYPQIKDILVPIIGEQATNTVLEKENSKKEPVFTGPF